MATLLPLGQNPKTEKKMNTLIADDSSTTRVALKQILNSECFNIIVEAEDGIDAINKIKLLPKGTTLDIVFIDKEMPNMDGIQLLASIRNMKIDAKAIIVAGDTNKETLKSFMQLGIIGYIVKPFDRKFVIQSLSKALGRNDYLKK